MRSSLLLTPVLLAALNAFATAQTLVIPSSAANSEGSSSTSYPWNRNVAGGHRVQYCYDSSHFSATTPLVIQRIRWRANGSTSASWSGVTHPNVQIDISSAANDYTSLSSTFASNHGSDRSTVYTGNVVVAPSPASGSTSPNGYYVDVQFATPFVYDPSQGKDLLIDVTLPGAWTGGTNSYTMDSVSTGSMVSRVYSLSDATSPTGSVQSNVGPVIELTAAPATGIYSSFTATPITGQSPLQVQFTDTTYSSDPGGVTRWEWDFNGDSIVDSTLQNPSFVFTGSGYEVKYSVTLKTTDASNGSSTVTQKDLITVNPFPVASTTSFGKGSMVPATPAPMQLPAFKSTYTYATHTRGYWFQAPTTFVITSLEVPNEAGNSEQSVWLFTFSGTSQPSGTTSIQSSDTKFLGNGPAGAPIALTTPIVITQGAWVGVVGATHDTGSSTMNNSYGSGGSGYSTTVLGQTTTLTRLMYQSSLVGASGAGDVLVQSSGDIGRVELGIPGNYVVPTLTASGDDPFFGSSPKLVLTANIPGAQLGIVGLALQRLPVGVPTPFGDLNIAPNFLLMLQVPGGNGELDLMVPSDVSLADAHLYYQGILFDLSNNVFGMTNGIDWHIGQR
jgi:PKD repeat protein